MHAVPTRNRWLRYGAGLIGAASLTAFGGAPAAFAADGPQTATPIKHLVVIFQENVSFDHYFGTYPNAANTADDKVKFTAKPGTPKVDGLSDDLLHKNPNRNNPQRLGPAQAVTCDQDHTYKDEQLAFDGGKMDKFVEHTDIESCKAPMYTAPGLVMDYYDGNTVTGYWNYAQRFAMSDNSFGTNYGPSTPGAINLVSGQLHGGYPIDPKTGQQTTDAYVVASPDAKGIGTVINDPDPGYDDCSDPKHNHLVMTGKNVGDLLNDKGVSWGWFQGGFKPTGTKDGKAVCESAHKNIVGATQTDYNPHHEPFQYYKSTANPQHLAPKTVDEIGHDGQANHQYDLTDFDAALQHGNLPAVSYLKAANYQDGHAGYSDPLDEQHFVVDTLNKLQKSKDWASTAVVIAYDDSDGWYDHKFAEPVNGSKDAANDSLSGPGQCGKDAGSGGYADRCGFGPRLPLLVASPYAKANFVDHTQTDQTSILRFVEDNWKTGRIGDYSFDEHAGSIEGMFDFKNPQSATLILDPTTGQPVGGDTPSGQPTGQPTGGSSTTPAGSATSTDGSTTVAGATSSVSGPPLAETGANSNTGPIAAAAVALLALGGGAVLLARRKRGRRA
ncbi:phospholipase C [Kitasatospora aureofaciens]|uniref:phospholipase C n=1 Tax=Kitasatospora aureofaciens TaxID=1894 RepID=A0A1E7NF49_KITAU|nr:alkaline phosphatase family protein [Kitasatospora aureofaciens]QEV03174.1 LPXTG cell wall anchor domain-containing protein [Streptomyces viridifaciens]ARF82465.1 phospholipase [Kitasatospora aureofaciens]OEV39268.1 phospholipase [Kitasatospora aureofaciens]UKZ09837.1 alkaline phosphatase family protein [Streptomyces viridifaciens]GGU88313.1 phospholipase C [Kitasatospora aureofaciens]